MTMEMELPLDIATSGFGWNGDRLTRTHTFGGTDFASSVEIDRTGDDLGDWWRSHLAGLSPKPAAKLGKLRTVDLFSGPGGLATGFRMAASEMGYSVVSSAAVDQDAEAVQVYAANHTTRLRSTESTSMLIDHHVSGRGDTAKFLYEPELTRSEWEPLVGNVDVVLAGPPCQGHSNLNNRSRRDDKRNELYLAVPAIALALGAPIVIIENVPAVVHDRFQVVASTERLLKEAGYTIEKGTVSASDLGWPQSRRRFFVVARLDTAPVPFTTISGMLDDDPRDVTWAIGDLARTAFDDDIHLATDISEENRRRIDYLFDHDLHDLPMEERPDCHKDGTTYNAVYGRLYPDRPAPTITTGFMTPGRGRYIHPTERRTLTPKEAARIQGFPDTYAFHPDPKNPASKAKLAKWIGDAVPMPLGHAAGLSALGGGAVPTG